MYPTIEIDKDTEFFVALCLRKTIHSFVGLGVKTNVGHYAMLGAYGKVVEYPNQSTNCCFLGSSPAKLFDERIFYSNIDRQAIESDIRYKAYGITYKQYIEFLAYLKALSIQQEKRNREFALHAYYPIEENASDTMTLSWKPLKNFQGSIENESLYSENFSEHSELKSTNTCRHSAIQLTSKCSNINNLGAGIGNFFLQKPPLKANLNAGNFDSNKNPLYILPLPPQCFKGISREKQLVMSKLYNNLDRLILTKQESKLTLEKFRETKVLYESITANENPSIGDLLSEITTWMKSNKTLIATHRNHLHWPFLPTATERLFNTLEGQLRLQM